jgi:hypothetical protein
MKKWRKSDENECAFSVFDAAMPCALSEMYTKCADFKGMRNVNGVFRPKTASLFDKSPQKVGPIYRAVIHAELVKFKIPIYRAVVHPLFYFFMLHEKPMAPGGGPKWTVKKRRENKGNDHFV